MTIQLALESPISMMSELCPLGSIELCFIHLLKEKESIYKKYYFDAKGKGRFLILDNGIMEIGYSMSTDDLLLTASDLKPDLVTPPETLGDGASTLNLTYEFIRAFESSKLYPTTKILGVAHGSDFKSWCSTFQELSQIPYIARIGIPYRIPFDIFTQNMSCSNKLKTFVTRRIEICDWIAENHPTSQVHLFGLAHPSELPFHTKHKFIKSIDTSLPIMAAVKNISYEVSNLGPYEKEILDMNWPHSELIVRGATHNINVMKQILQ